MSNDPFAIDERAHAAQLYGQGNYAEAAMIYRKLAEEHPMQAASWRSLGLALALNGEIELGIEACKKAILLDTNDGEAHFALGYCYGANHCYDEAISELDAALLIQPMHAAARQSLVFSLVARARELVSTDLVGAEQRFNRARKLDSKNPELLANLLKFYVDTRQKGKALKLIEEAEPSLRQSDSVSSVMSDLAQNPDYAIALKSTLRSAKKFDSRPQSAPSSLQQKPCPRCGQLMPEYSTTCPHCQSGTVPAGVLPIQRPKPPVIWQEVGMSVFTLIWAAMAGTEILLFLKAQGGPFVGYLVVLDAVRIGVSLFILFRSEWISSAAKIVCYISLLVSAALSVMQVGISHWGAAGFEFGQVVVTGFVLYLVNFNLGD